MYIKKIIIIVLSLLTFNVLVAQSPQIDSLRNLINTTSDDTVKINSLNNLAKKLLRQNMDNSLDTINLSITLATDAEFYKGLGEAYKIKSVLFYMAGQLDTGIFYLEKSLQIYEENSFDVEAAKCYNNLGLFYKKKGDYKLAIKNFMLGRDLLKNIGERNYYFDLTNNLSNSYRNVGNYHEALNINYEALHFLTEKEVADSVRLANIYKSIANIYNDQKKWQAADSNYLEALLIYKKMNLRKDIGDIYINLGVVASRQEDYPKAKEYYEDALPYYKSDEKILLALNNLGEVCVKQKNYDSAYFYLDSALILSNKLGEVRTKGFIYLSYGDINNAKKEYGKATENLEKALEYANSIGDVVLIKEISASLYLAYKNVGNYKKALELHEVFKAMNDSIFNKNNEQDLTAIAMSYEFKKEKEKAEFIHQEKLKKQKNLIFGVGFISVVLLIFSIVTLNNIRTIKRKNKALNDKNAEIIQQKEEIERQKEQIEEQRDSAEKAKEEINQQKKSIEASIRYAYRIQRAVIPAIEPLKNNFSDYLVFFKPRDIVSGDFYWVAQKGKNVIIVASDCTGHGVPGAFMSMLGVSLLNQMLVEHDALEPAEMLGWLRKNVIKSLKQKDGSNNSKDGMDMAMVVYNSDNKVVKYSGAYNSLYLILDKSPEFITENSSLRSLTLDDCDRQLYEVRANRMPIGVFVKDDVPFTQNVVRLKKGDRFYIFSDGYPDLFSRENEVKFTTKRFKKLLLSSSHLAMEEQYSVIEEKYNDWCKGGKQIDDIVIVGAEV